MITVRCGTVELVTALIICEPFLMMPVGLEVLADHEAGDVLEEQQRHVDLVAELDEVGGLLRRTSG